MRTYLCLWRGKRLTVQANTTLEAQTLAAKQFKARKQYEVSVYLADEPVDAASI